MIRKYMTPRELLDLRNNFKELFGHEDPTKLCQSDRDVFCNTYYSNLGQYCKPYQKVALVRAMLRWVVQVQNHQFVVDMNRRNEEASAANAEAARVERNRKERERKARKAGTSKPPAQPAQLPAKHYVIAFGKHGSWAELCSDPSHRCIVADSTALKDRLIQHGQNQHLPGCITLFELQVRSNQNPSGEPKLVSFKLNRHVTYDLVLG